MMKPLILNSRLSPTDKLPLDETFAVGFPGCEEQLRVNIGAACLPNYHAEWMWEMIQECASEPLVIFVDGDVVFHESVLDIEMPDSAMMMGMREDRHFNPVTKAIHVERLHTCVLWVRPQRVLAATDALNARWQGMPLRGVLPIHQIMMPPCSDDGYDQPHFFDTGAMAYHWWPNQMATLLGRESERFTHLHCGEWSVVAEANGMKGLQEAHRQLRAGTMPFAVWRLQCAAFYRERAVG